MTKEAGRAAAMAIAAALAAIGSTALPWITAGVGSEAPTYSGLELPAAAMPVVAGALATVVLALASLWRSPTWAPYAGLASGIGALFAAATIAAFETAALMIPSAFLPDTVDRAGFALGAGYGLWLALGALTVATLAMHGPLSRVLALRLRLPRQNRMRAAALACLGALTILIGWLRYRTWIDASLLDRHLELPAWVAPWIGPLSLLSVWMLAGAFALAAFSTGPLPGLVAAAAGWLTSTIAALSVIAVGVIGELGLENLAPAAAGAGFEVTWFVWLSFAAGLAAAAVGALLVRGDAPQGDSRSWRF